MTRIVTYPIVEDELAIVLSSKADGTFGLKIGFGDEEEEFFGKRRDLRIKVKELVKAIGIKRSPPPGTLLLGSLLSCLKWNLKPTERRLDPGPNRKERRCEMEAREMPNKFPKLPFKLGDGGTWCDGLRGQGKMSFSPKMKATAGNKSKKYGEGKAPEIKKEDKR